MPFDDIGSKYYPEPGILPSAPFPITNIRRISPSLFSVFNSCKLKGIWVSNYMPSLLPLPPNLHIGNVVHKTLQLSNLGLINDKREFDVTWTQLIHHEEEKMSSNWLERSLVPLSKTCNDYEVKKKFIEKSILESTHNVGEKDGLTIDSSNEKIYDGNRNGLFEKWIESEDGILGGYVDAIVPEPEGDILIDYKTGKIFENEDVKTGIKDDYLFQLRLYAALYHENYHRWPYKIEIRSFGELICQIDVDQKECLKAFDDAISLFKTTNALITESTEGTSGGRIDRLSNPSPKNCRYCQFRPLCKAYWAAKQQRSEEEWPFDVKGKVLENTLLKNGKILLKIIPPDPGAEPIFIKSVQPDRHPFIGSIGDNVMICSLRPERHSKNFQEGELTIFYLIGKDK